MTGELAVSGYSPRPASRPKPFLLSFCLASLLCLSFFHHLPRVALLRPPRHFNLEQLLLSVPDAAKARQWSVLYTSELRFPGQTLPSGLWTQELWEEFGIDTTSIETYSLSLPLPLHVSSRLALVNQTDGEVLYEAALAENATDPNPLTGEILNAPQFVAFAPSFKINASVVYANHGRPEDFEDLARANISVVGKIAIVKFGLPGSKFYEILQQTGIAGWIVYRDPEMDGEISEANGYLAYPDGPARAPTSVFRQNGAHPGKDSEPVPVMAISYADAVPILKALNGIGPHADDLGSRWQGGQLGYRGVEYNVGPSPPNIVLDMQNKMKDSHATLYTLVGEIEGQIKDEVVIIGNHRDAWATGAADPASGSAALNEVVRAFGTAVRNGWRPLRTLIFISWDGNEIGLFGSANYVKDNLPWLFNRTVAYFETVAAVSGPNLYFQFSPLLGSLVRDVTGQIQSPNQTIAGQTVLDVWGGDLRAEGGGDSTPFTRKTITSGQFGFAQGLQDPVWHKHSSFDTIAWMDRFGDPTWQYHVTAAQIWGLLAARLVDSPVYPFNVTEYAVALRRYFANIQNLSDTKENFCFDFVPLHEALLRLHTVALQFDAESEALRNAHACKSTSNDLSAKMHAVNTKYRLFERQFYYAGDADSDPKNNHVVFTPITQGKDSLAELPDLWNAVDSMNVAETEKWENIIRSKVEDAIAHLEDI